jgi:hypothetical protein
MSVTFPALGGTSTDSLVLGAGIDEDHDGRLNEDPTGDSYNDGRPGKMGYDDDADGKIDEDALGRAYGTAGWGTFAVNFGSTAIPNDDDEDGVQDEDPANRVAYRFANGVLTEEIDGASQILASGLGAFEAKLSPAARGTRRQLRVRIWYGAAADTAARFESYIFPANGSTVFGVRNDG